MFYKNRCNRRSIIYNNKPTVSKTLLFFFVQHALVIFADHVYRKKFITSSAGKVRAHASPIRNIFKWERFFENFTQRQDVFSKIVTEWCLPTMTPEYSYSSVLLSTRHSGWKLLHKHSPSTPRQPSRNQRTGSITYRLLLSTNFQRVFGLLLSSSSASYTHVERRKITQLKQVRPANQPQKLKETNERRRKKNYNLAARSVLRKVHVRCEQSYTSQSLLPYIYREYSFLSLSLRNIYLRYIPIREG